MPTKQGRYFFVTLSKTHADEHNWTPEEFYNNNEDVEWAYGQEEIGSEGYHHYQFIFATSAKMSIFKATKLFNGCKPHLELSRSNAADKYVRKEDTSVPNSQFELGSRVMKVRLINIDLKDKF